MVHDCPIPRLKGEKQMVRVPSALSTLLESVTPHVPPITCAALKSTPASSLSHTLMGSRIEFPVLETVSVTVACSPGLSVLGLMDFERPTLGCVQLTSALA